MFASEDRADFKALLTPPTREVRWKLSASMAGSLSKLCFGSQDGGERENEHADGANDGWLMVNLPWAGWLDGRTSQKR